MKSKLKFVLLFVMLSFMFSLSAQNLSVSGVVYDDLGETLPSASVRVKGTDKGTVTDMDGKFTVRVPMDATLEISFMGYATKRVKVTGGKTLKITLEPDAMQLDEVVAIGYAGVKKSDLTGSVQSIKTENLTMSSASNAAQMLQGRATGLYVNSANMDPGAIPTMTLRGQGSFAGNGDPLVIIDGFPMDDLGALNRINPNDIVQMDVLKDASAAAIYGSRGANGVIIVTTKTGREGKLKIEYSGKIYTQTIAKDANMMNSEEYTRFYHDLAKDPTFAHTYRTGFNGEYYAYPIEYYYQGLLADTSWKDEVLNKNLNQEHNLSVSGGSSDFKYRASGNFFDGNALVGPADYRRYNFATKLVYEKNKLYLNVDMNYTQELRNNVKPDYYNALRFPPVVPIYDSEGKPSKYPIESMGWMDETNPFSYRQLNKNNSEENTFRMFASAKYNLLKGLYLEGRFGYERRFNENFWDQQPYDTVVGKNKAGIQQENWSNLLNDWILNYAVTFKGHSISVLAGTSFQKYRWRMLNANNSEFPSSDISYYQLQAGIGVDYGFNSGWTERATQAFFGRLNYDYKGRYLATVNFRADAATQFGENNKWGYFPSFAFAWKVDRESFFNSSNPYVNTLKLKVGYGLAGNSDVPNGRTQSLLNYRRATMGDGVVNGVEWNGDYIPNPDLHWEKSATANFGVEAGNSFFYFDLNYYIKNSSDLLMERQMPHETGFKKYTINKGKMLNKGLEMKLDFYLDFFNRQLQWKPSVWFSINKNEVKDIDGDEILWNSLYYGTEKGYAGIRKAGTPYNAMYGYIFDGIWSTEEVYVASVYGAKPGDPKFKDINGYDKDGNVVAGRDGKLDEADKVYLGNGSPKYLGGFSSSLRYKGIELNFMIEAVLDKKVANLNRITMTGPEFEWYGNLSREALDRWTPEHQNTDVPSLTRVTDPKLYLSTWCIQDASFVRMRDLTLSYLIPLKKGFFIEELKVFSSVTNLFTITKYKGINPDVQYIDGRGNMNPFTRTITFGINLSL